MAFHAILRHILKNHFCAIFSRDFLSVLFFTLLQLWPHYDYHTKKHIIIQLFSNRRLYFDIPNIFKTFWFFTYFNDVFAFCVLHFEFLEFSFLFFHLHHIFKKFLHIMVACTRMQDENTFLYLLSFSLFTHHKVSP